MATDDTVTPTKFQQAVLRFRGHCNILNAGGRGSGKSFSMMLDLIDHMRQHRADARPLVLRGPISPKLRCPLWSENSLGRLVPESPDFRRK